MSNCAACTGTARTVADDGTVTAGTCCIGTGTATAPAPAATCPACPGYHTSFCS